MTAAKTIMFMQPCSCTILCFGECEPWRHMVPVVIKCVWVSAIESFCEIPVYISQWSLKIKDWNMQCKLNTIYTLKIGDEFWIRGILLEYTYNYGLIVLIATDACPCMPTACLYVSSCNNVCILYWAWDWDAKLHHQGISALLFWFCWKLKLLW